MGKAFVDYKCHVCNGKGNSDGAICYRCQGTGYIGKYQDVPDVYFPENGGMKELRTTPTRKILKY